MQRCLYHSLGKSLDMAYRDVESELASKVPAASLQVNVLIITLSDWDVWPDQQLIE